MEKKANYFKNASYALHITIWYSRLGYSERNGAEVDKNKYDLFTFIIIFCCLENVNMRKFLLKNIPFLLFVFSGVKNSLVLVTRTSYCNYFVNTI